MTTSTGPATFTFATARGVADPAYPGARLEILLETNRAEVEAGILSWLDRITPA